MRSVALPLPLRVMQLDGASLTALVSSSWKSALWSQDSPLRKLHAARTHAAARLPWGSSSDEGPVRLA